jgi:hypothetical protein
MDQKKSDAAAYAPEILMLAQARRAFMTDRGDDVGDGSDWPFVSELERRLRVLLDIEEAK